jgi:hypothetical protein
MGTIRFFPTVTNRARLIDEKMGPRSTMPWREDPSSLQLTAPRSLGNGAAPQTYDTIVRVLSMLLCNS